MIVTGKPARKEVHRRLWQRSEVAATASGQRPRQSNQRPGSASIIPRITKKIDIVSAISIDIVLLTSSDPFFHEVKKGATADALSIQPRCLSIKRLSSWAGFR